MSASPKTCRHIAALSAAVSDGGFRGEARRGAEHSLRRTAVPAYTAFVSALRAGAGR